MIRYSDKKDLSRIIDLWHEAFGDSEDEICFFLDSCYVPQNTIVYESEDEIASVLFLLEGNMSVNGTDYPSYYLYAACTLKKYRGRGLMAELLDFAKKTADFRNKSFICLRPGEKSLFCFYEKHGYKSIFKIKKSVVFKDGSYIKHNEQSNVSINREKLRNNAFSDFSYFKWDKQFIDYAFMHNKFFGGFSSETSKGYSIFNISGNEINVKETTFSDISTLINSFPSDILSEIVKINVNFPPETDVEGEIVPYAMIMAVNKKAEQVIKNTDNAYLGLTLE